MILKKSKLFLRIFGGFLKIDLIFYKFYITFRVVRQLTYLNSVDRNNTYVIHGLHNGKVYGFAFSARNAAGEGDSLYIDVDLNDQIDVSSEGMTLVGSVTFLVFAIFYQFVF